MLSKFHWFVVGEVLILWDSDGSILTSLSHSVSIRPLAKEPNLRLISLDPVKQGSLSNICQNSIARCCPVILLAPPVCAYGLTSAEKIGVRRYGTGPCPQSRTICSPQHRLHFGTCASQVLAFSIMPAYVMTVVVVF